MKTRLFLLTLGWLASFALGDFTARSQEVSVSASLQINAAADFYAPLTPYGSWVEVGSYGRCWHPRVEAEWRPYVEGEWVWTDAGWYWQSDEPWAWACHHYGSWVDDPTYGWVWIPGTEWAPAWVTWREGPDYIGWAPCGPNFVVLGAPFFVFVDIHHFHDHIHRRSVIINNTTIIEHSRVINNFRHETRDFDGARRRIAINDGPRVETIQRATGTRVAQRPVHDMIRQTPMPDSTRRDRRESPTSTNARQQPTTNPRQPSWQPDRSRQSDRWNDRREPTGRSDSRVFEQQPQQPAPQTPNVPRQNVPAPAQQDVPRPPQQPAPFIPNERPIPTPPTERPIPPARQEMPRADHVAPPQSQRPADRHVEPQRERRRDQGDQG